MVVAGSAYWIHFWSLSNHLQRPWYLWKGVTVQDYTCLVHTLFLVDISNICCELWNDKTWQLLNWKHIL